MARFGTVINCIDGRVQEPVNRWLKDTYRLDYVDVVTEPGPDRVLARGAIQALYIRDKVRVSIEAHQSTVLAIVGHEDCVANPGPRQDHVDDIRRAVDMMRWWNPAAILVGLWVSKDQTVEVIVTREQSTFYSAVP